MDILNSIHSIPKTITELDLSEKEIQDLTPLMNELLQFTELESLNLESNEFKDLPENLGGLTKLETLNINNNPLSNIGPILEVLKTLPSLKNLVIRIEGNDEAEAILFSLPKLATLNGSEISDEDRLINKAEENNENHIKETPPDKHSEEEQPIKEEEDPQLKNEENSDEKIEMQAPQIKQANLPIAVDKVIIKQEEKSELVIPETIPSEGATQSDIGLVSEALKQLNTLRESDGIEGTSAYDNFQKSMNQYKSISNLEEANPQVAMQIIQLLDNDISEFVSHKLTALTKVLTLKTNLLRRVGNKASNSKDERLKKENDALRRKIHDIEEENKSYLNQIIKHSKDSAKKELAVASTISPSQGYAKASISTAGKKVSQVKPLSLNQLKDLFEDIYAQKKKYDEKCFETKQPKETMEQYIYTYLNQKYGLKSLILEWATAIINGIRAFSTIDADVAMFGKILKNSCDEEFRIIQSQVKNAMVEILKDKLKKKFKTKGEGEILAMIQEIQNSEVEEWAWSEIIQKMYNEEHANTLMQKIRFFIEDKKQQADKNMRKHLSREELIKSQREKEVLSISYSDLQMMLLDFQLKSHESYLKKFVELFRSVDLDTNGIIDESQLKEVLAAMQISDEEVSNQILLRVDPFNHSIITFSDTVSALASICVENEKITLLEKYIAE